MIEQQGNATSAQRDEFNRKRIEDDGRDQAKGDAEYGKVKLVKPLDISSDDPGGDPYNSTGRFSRAFR